MLFKKFGSDGQAIVDSLNSFQGNYTAKDFILCTAKVKPITKLDKDTSKCFIGKVGFSKLYLDEEKNRGLLSYEFVCGGLCGRTALLVIRRTEKRWIIED